MESEFQISPEGASSFADRFDQLWAFLVGVSGFFSLLIAVLIVVFAIKFRRRPRARQIEPKSKNYLILEIVWTIIPLGLVMVMFVWGALLYVEMRQVPEEHDSAYVVGKQWMWHLQQPDGKREINKLHVPVGRAVQLKMISEDVIHSFYIPAFRVKMDVLPGRYTTMWFKPTKVGQYHLFCAEYCGTSHSHMIGTIHVMDPASYAAWLSGDTGEPVDVAGRKLFERFKCHTCHRTEGGKGPSLVDLFGRRVPLKSGETVVADETYVRESILRPQAKIVAGFEPVMPTFEGQINEDQILQIIAYLRTLQKPEAR